MNESEGRTIRVVALLAGQVQNVGFRYTVLQIAQRHDVVGSVRNLRSGRRVEIDVEGEPEAVEAFLADVLAHPPPGAHVTHVERSTAEPRGLHAFTAADTV